MLSNCEKELQAIFENAGADLAFFGVGHVEHLEMRVDVVDVVQHPGLGRARRDGCAIFFLAVMRGNEMQEMFAHKFARRQGGRGKFGI